MTEPWDQAQLAAARAASPLAALVPLVRALLGQAAREAELLVVVADSSGRVLWLEGEDDALATAEAWGLLAGTEWALVNGALTGLGRALATRTPQRVDSPDASPHPWAAAPVRDPRSGTMPGALAVTGSPAALDAFVLAALRGTASTVEAHLATTSGGVASGSPVGSSSAHALLRLTGPDAPALDTPHGTSPLNRRHAELLATLAEAPGGLAGTELMARVYPQPITTVTLRAEMSRLRKALEAAGAFEAGVGLSSRPYRLTGVEDDGARVAAHLHRGALQPALNEYGGELLPGSEAPAVVARREELSAALRGAVLGAGNPDLLQAYLRLPEADGDAQAWEIAAQVLPDGSPRQAAALAHLDGLSGLGPSLA
ncbi:sigma-54-dependent transcriptional regulator family protein [Galactobacter caseinivorans]|uniref:Transcriptional regulator n=1 Tax=Galactobacter caseinivorans TaxID=2676123 RepID=A0A496PHW2_9MICC|nr:helix-turn-helix domain-containing protein [Galactobacter caseinivorans]RKW70040.1 transcriptional regulator [Galactobacter caseinivorans]